MAWSADHKLFWEDSSSELWLCFVCWPEPEPHVCPCELAFMWECDSVLMCFSHMQLVFVCVCVCVCVFVCCGLLQVMWRRCVGTRSRGCCSPAAQTTPSSCGTSEGAKARPSKCKDTSTHHKHPQGCLLFIWMDNNDACRFYANRLLLSSSVVLLSYFWRHIAHSCQ